MRASRISSSSLMADGRSSYRENRRNPRVRSCDADGAGDVRSVRVSVTTDVPLALEAGLVLGALVGVVAPRQHLAEGVT
jgi:hypothetical protein